jgi:hypothetical protein
MKNLRLVLFLGLLVILIALGGFAAYVYFTGNNPIGDHAVPYRNNMMPGPEGFSWKDHSDIGFKILVPDNWYWDEANVNKEEYYIAKVSWEETPLFITGVVISVFRDIYFPEIQSRRYFENILQGENTIKDISHDTKRAGKATIKELMVKEKDPNFPDGDPKNEKLVQYQFISRPDLHILYVIRFECPSGDWPEEWEKGRVLLDSFTIVN